jgi:phosphatidate cytidylyltransferase
VSSLQSRILVGVPLAAATFAVAYVGGWAIVVFAALAALVAQHEYSAVTRDLRPIPLAGMIGTVAVVIAIHRGGPVWGAAAVGATLVLAFWLSAVSDVRQRSTVQLATTMLGVIWIGFGFGFLVAVRDIPAPSDWGRTLAIGVLLGVWASDIVAYAVGRLIGRRQMARRISPNKTWEGFVAGFVFGTAAVFFTVYHQPAGDQLSPLHALELALAIAIAGPVGDLFESYVKRDMDVKDTGRLLGGHGGVLDRVDALIFAGVAAYYVSLALGRG